MIDKNVDKVNEKFSQKPANCVKLVKVLEDYYDKETLQNMMDLLYIKYPPRSLTKYSDDENKMWSKRLSDFHRKLNASLMAMDIDSILTTDGIGEPSNALLEIGYGEVKAIIEYKHYHWNSQNNTMTRYLSRLATKAELPFFIVKYNDNFTEFVVSPENSKAHEIIKDFENYDTVGFEKFLINIRNK